MIARGAVRQLALNCQCFFVGGGVAAAVAIRADGFADGIGVLNVLIEEAPTIVSITGCAQTMHAVCLSTIRVVPQTSQTHVWRQG